MTCLTNLGVTWILSSIRLVPEGQTQTGKEIPESSRLEFVKKVSPNNFVLSDGEDNTSGLLNIGGIADLLLLRKLLANCKPSFWEVMDSFLLA